ncbi:MAG: hypothetical protein A3G33_11625 [Omnitrophica bacterium RIFCSPLOWO2_12_FULL_44_17]|uniref:HD-GYP domain-containing protein n=1 Tax=Candidatus Danuiimicrobium aquiferis TaxID=1801832 RepID=A0A1G1KRV7_9BACT|nr:MAG: hypothetical protein A3B72_09465 [Omnitrophica bacterium RIFCSPHIGHO2_02_FULL_45_28]OGW91237.1 MAG: hypothetical protein A3E74_03000 [Omnitrophica bacterium RIFCSPHIGHO2_12_FULL_44_12]OGW95638.1 MAG: hypothetical protein A3G33_11625 [Omnitrophica bacterium RIFCSPLOWO2_12_FULL_44_17]OGX03649.1 MAG: hypothetical protein A3J12_00870 [Omnitrophica bacterium RIFCSPLOWO2_02_FULL_44_11]
MTSFEYQEALKNAAKSMVRVKNPRRLLKMIVRFINREVGLSHASILMYDQDKSQYIFVDSRGRHRIPIKLVKLDERNPLIRWFSEKGNHTGKDRLSKDYLTHEQVNLWLKNPAIMNNGHADELKEHILQLQDVMLTLKAAVCVPGYYKKELLGVLILGEKIAGGAFTPEELSFFQTLANDASMTIKNARYQEDLLAKNLLLEKKRTILQERLREIEQMRKKEQETYYQIVMSLAREVYAKDPYTSGHMEDVARLGVMTAEKLGFDLTGKKKDILVAALHLHDVGKIGIPDHVLMKPERLTDEEWKIMKEHPSRGAMILEPLTDFKRVAHIVRHHHERFDGKGYPDGLKGEEIPIEARIIAVVDAFHAIVSTRCYRRGRSVLIAFDELRANAGTQFDAEVVNAFIAAYQSSSMDQTEYKSHHDAH